MSQPGSSGRNTPTASRSHLPPTMASGHAPTLADLTRVVLDLGVAVGHITTQLNTLAQQVMLATSTHPQAAKVVVACPKAWNGKGGSVEARNFLAAFANYAGNEGDTLNDWDSVNSRWIQNDELWIAAALNLMKDEARTWALPYLELLAQELLAFQGNYSLFVQAFLKRFTPPEHHRSCARCAESFKTRQKLRGGVHFTIRPVHGSNRLVRRRPLHQVLRWAQ